jgi:GGDEF domain-containing protein
VKFTTLRRAVDAKMTGGFREAPWKIDGLTGLPWFTTIHGETAGRAVTQDLHVVQIHLARLGAVIDAHGPSTSGSVLREVARRAASLLDDRDLLSRHTNDRLLLVTGRSPAEVTALVQKMAAELGAAGVEVDGERLPRVQVGVAPLPRASDYAEAVARLDTAILAAELDVGPVVSPAAAVPAAPEAAGRLRAHRPVLTSMRLDLSGLVATAIVELTIGRRSAVARSVGRNAEGRRLFLIGEATARAVTDLLPAGYGAVIHDVQVLQPGTAEQGRGILSSVLFLSPDNEQYLFGVAAAGTDPRLAAARAALSAVNRRIEPLLAAAGG